MSIESDKAKLHVDAKRLFYDEDLGRAAEYGWETIYDQKYNSRTQASRHAERDGTAFATIALPAHYTAIFSIFDHLKRRLGPTWEVGRVIDWGAGTGTGLWFDLLIVMVVDPRPELSLGRHCILSRSPTFPKMKAPRRKARYPILPLPHTLA